MDRVWFQDSEGSIYSFVVTYWAKDNVYIEPRGVNLKIEHSP